MLSRLGGQNRLLAIVAVTLVAAYICWKIAQSPEQSLQFAFNGLSVGAVYALLAMGFTIVYSTVWFFDLYYGAAAALGAYGVFYLRSQETLGGLYEVNSLYLNAVFAAVVASVVAWALHTAFTTVSAPAWTQWHCASGWACCPWAREFTPVWY